MPTAWMPRRFAAWRGVAGRTGASAMSLYSYVPDKQALVHDMVEHEPTGMPAGARLESIALINGFVVNLVRAELADSALSPPDHGQSARYQSELHDLLASGRYPRFAAAVQQAGMTTIDLGAQFDRLLDRLLDRVLDGLVPQARAAEPGR
jgi:AcrR family transcriptional regulator